MLASAQGWSQEEKALQLVTALWGPAVEVLGHLPPPQCGGGLQRRFGHHHQAEVYRAHLKKWTREHGKMLPQLAQDVEALVRRLYPAALEEMIVVQARDFFVDTLQDQQLQIYVKQAHPEDLQVVLARALEFEALLEATSGLEPAAQNCRDLWGRKVKMKAVSWRVSLYRFHISCWGCGEKGHRRSRCPTKWRMHPFSRPDSDAFQQCCKN
ncbi:uncharacterized protein LOC122245155 [Penaeus japonicus]|uniref:uncharacterized protein LOC122245155 n=1 Tax=Penaeus japonicus TaxID=27405 RepID=UPI001C714F27|nr:uncharacterized protein LOC122245155 [Penaeus japonicus]